MSYVRDNWQSSERYGGAKRWSEKSRFVASQAASEAASAPA